MLARRGRMVGMGGYRGIRRVAESAGAIAIAAILLTGCAASVDGASPIPSPTRAPTPALPAPSIPPVEPTAEPSNAPSPDPRDEPGTESPAPGPTPDPQPSQVPDAPLRGLPFSLSCEAMITPQQLYDYNPNVGADPGHRPRDGSGPARAVELSGTACGWLNQTSGQTLSISVAKFDAPNLARVRELARSAGGTSTGLGMDGHYRTESGLGVVDAFTGSYWIAAESATFLAPEDVAPLLDAIRRNLP
jgi:hypothetical protein